MSEPIVEVDTFSASVVVPQNGIDLRNAESVKVPFQALANRTKNLNTRTTHDHSLLLNNGHLHYPVLEDPGADEWGLQTNYTNGTRWLEQSVVNSSHRYFAIPLTGLPAAGWRFSQIAVWLKGTSPHACATQPTVTLIRMHEGVDTVATFVGTAGVDDTEAATYDEWHQVLVGGLAGTEIELGSAYWLRVGGEQDSGAVANLRCYGARVILNVPTTYPYP
jgi:hypothetical protein